ncbi:hypothetical protein BVRB_040790, partial [Beta vulgaris subsp. vulgaris]
MYEHGIECRLLEIKTKNQGITKRQEANLITSWNT